MIELGEDWLVQVQAPMRRAQKPIDWMTARRVKIVNIMQAS